MQTGSSSIVAVAVAGRHSGAAAGRVVVAAAVAGRVVVAAAVAAGRRLVVLAAGRFFLAAGRFIASKLLA